MFDLKPLTYRSPLQHYDMPNVNLINQELYGSLNKKEQLGLFVDTNNNINTERWFALELRTTKICIKT